MTAIDAAQPIEPTPEQAVETAPRESLLDRQIDLTKYGAFGIVGALTMLASFLLRFVALDGYVLNQREALWAHSGWSFFRGSPLPAGQDLPLIAPLFLILEAFGFFLFGTTDAIARGVPAAIGVGLVGLAFALRPFLPRHTVLATAIILAISPTFVFASRTIDPMIVLVFCALLAVVALLRAGASTSNRAAWFAGAGAATGGVFASGPEGVSAIIAISIAFGVASGLDTRAGGPVSATVSALGDSMRSWLAFLIGTLAVVALAFTRLLADFTALEGVLTTLTSWGRMMATQTSSTPAPFFLYALLLYEGLAVVFSIIALSSTDTRTHDPETERPYLTAPLFLTWGIVALVLGSLSSGKQPDQTAMIALPLVLLAGIGLGNLSSRIPWRTLTTSRAGLIPATILGVLIGVIAAFTLIARGNDEVQTAQGDPSTTIQVLFVMLLVVLPLGYVLFNETANRRGGMSYLGWSALLVLAVLLGCFSVRSATELAYERADTGAELLAPRMPTDGVQAFVDQTLRLSRDVSLSDVSNIDNTGSYGLSIAVDPALEWPFTWYFRDFPELRVTGPAGWNEADMVVAPTAEGMAEAGYVVNSRIWTHRTPTTYEELRLSTVLTDLFTPSRWYDAIRYLVYRDMSNPPVPDQLSIGYTFALNNQMNPSEGPFDLATGQSLGAGSALGQLNMPSGITLSGDGEMIYIVNAGNRRIERYARDGAFVGAWGAETDARLNLAIDENSGQGASDIVIGPDGLIYVADTWNHRIIVLDEGGQIVREFGMAGEISDLGDSPDPGGQPGLFFGPRSMAITDDEIFITDTGNERVQVLAPDGTFLRAFGGWGTKPGKLLEPVGIAIGPDGNVYVADSGNARISVFAPDGTPVTQIPVPGWADQGALLNYLRFGPDGLLYMTSPGAREAVVWNGEEIVPVLEGESPLGIAVAADGTVFVTSPSSSTVTEFVPTFPDGFTVPRPATPVATDEPTVVATPAP